MLSAIISNDYARPVLLFLLSILIYHLHIVLLKTKLTFQGILYLLFCNDKSWKKPQDPFVHFSPLLSTPEGKAKIVKKTIMFVRHGESTWNDTFNKGPHRSVVVFVIGFVPNLIKAILYELYLLFTGQIDSWFYDSPLNLFGLEQADKLCQFLSKSEDDGGRTQREKDLIAILRGDAGAPSSRLLSSSLRRSLSTVAAAFSRRLEKNPAEKILVHPSLQEISRNPDTLSITPKFAQPTPSWIDRDSKICDFQRIFAKRTDMSLHTGNKPLNTNGLLRMTKFCEYVFSDEGGDVDAFVVGGHSIYFRSFFRTFLPRSADHVSKKRKIVNGGCVAFSLWKMTTAEGDRYLIDPKSISVVYGGF